jgi:lipopolysaccharide export system protein LptA
MKTKLVLVLTLLYFGLIGGLALAADEPVKITGRNIHGDTGKKISYLEGNVRLVQGSTVITTDKATIYTDKKQVLLESHVQFGNRDGIVTADSLEYDFRKKSGTFRGNVVMRRKASQNKKSKTKKDPFTLYAAELFLETKTKNFTAAKGRLAHKDFNGTANLITYNDSGAEMTLCGRVDLKRPKGEAIQGEEIRINLQDKSFTATNEVNIQIAVDGDEPDKTKREPVKATGDTIRGDTEKKVTYLEGNVRITQGSTVITTAKAKIYNGSKKQAIFENRVKLVNEDGMVEADALNYDLRKKTGTFRGNVLMQRQASQDPKKKVKKDPFTLSGAELFLETKTKNFTAIRGQFVHQDFNGGADQLIYHDSEEELIFRGHVNLRRPKGETVQGEETRIYLKDKGFVATNKVSIQIDVDDDKTGQSKQTTTRPEEKPGKKQKF